MLEKIQQVIDDCLETYIEGELFFDQLDQCLRLNRDIIAYFINDIISRVDFDVLVVSGNFGLAVKQYWDHVNDPLTGQTCMVTNGGLRHGKLPEILVGETNLQEKRVIFADDSYYSGRTENRIKEMIDKNSGIFCGTYVIYDGCVTYRPWVHSYYRYYADHEK